MSGHEGEQTKLCCPQCHFLATTSHIDVRRGTLAPDPDGQFEREVSAEIRKALAALTATDRLDGVKGLCINTAMYCHHRLWESVPIGSDPNPELVAKLQKDRKGTCPLFLTYTPRVACKVEAAKQRLEAAVCGRAENRWLNTRSIIWGAGAGIFCLIIGAIIGFFLDRRECDRPHVPAVKVSALEKPAPAPPGPAPTTPPAKALPKK